MATYKNIDTRIKLKYDSHAEWIKNDPILYAGEVAIDVIPASTGTSQKEPIVLMKVGDGTKKFSALDYIGGYAIDVYSWAKAANKPTYAASEITDLKSFVQSNQIADTNTKYQIVKVSDYSYKLQSKELNGEWADQNTFTIPSYTVATGATNGTIKVTPSVGDAYEVAVKGLGSAAYTSSTAYDAAGAASKVLGSTSDNASAATVYGVKAAAAAAQTAANNAQTTANSANTAAATAQSTADSASAAASAAQETADKGVADAAAAQKTANTAVTDAATAQTTAEDGVTKANAAQTAANAAQTTANAAVKRAGDTMTGALTLSGAPTADLHAATKKYVDDKTAALAGATHFVGVKTSLPTSGTAGDICIVGKKEYIYDGTTWQELGDETLYVQKEEGKGLSSNDYTDAEKSKLGAIEAGAQVNVQSDWDATSGDAFIKNKPTSMKNPTALTFGSKTYDGSAAREITAADLGALTSHQDISGKQDNLSFDGTYNATSNKVATVSTVTTAFNQVSTVGKTGNAADLITDAIIFVLNCGSSSTVF